MILEEYKNFLKNEDKSKNTINTYIRHSRAFLEWLENRYGEIDFKKITLLDLRDYQKYLIRVKQYKAKGIEIRMRSVLSYAQFIYKKGYISKNITEDFKIIKVQGNIAPNVPSKNDINRFRRTVYLNENKRDIAMVEMFIGTGMRAGEMASLEISDIEMSERKGVVTIREGKGSKYRVVPLNGDIKRTLAEYIESRPKDKGSKLWIGERGGLTQSGINKMIERYACRANLSDVIHPHAFRNYMANELVKKGVDLKTVGTILGHSSIMTTQIYLNPTMNDIEKALEGIGL